MALAPASFFTENKIRKKTASYQQLFTLHSYIFFAELLKIAALYS
jgi:hypothetical protein